MKEHATELRVRFSETDAAGIVFFANFFDWADTVALIDYFKACGLTFNYLQQEGLAFVIGESFCRFMSPARFDDLLEIRTRVKEIKEKTISFEFDFFRKTDMEALAAGYITYVCISTNNMGQVTGKSMKIPEYVAQKLTAPS